MESTIIYQIRRPQGLQILWDGLKILLALLLLAVFIAIAAMPEVRQLLGIKNPTWSTCLVFLFVGWAIKNLLPDWLSIFLDRYDLLWFFTGIAAIYLLIIASWKPIQRLQELYSEAWKTVWTEIPLWQVVYCLIGIGMIIVTLFGIRNFRRGRRI